MSYDTVIRNGTLVDGSGAVPFPADVGISGGVITKVGRVTERGRREIDADGCVVTPGFIDGHTHMDAQVFWDPLGKCSCWHGVTTAVMGNCGFTLAPARRNQRSLVVRNLERAEDIAPEALAAGINWRWESFPEFLDVLDATPMGINYAANIGHSALRTWVMGERAFEEEASEADLSRMLDELGAALRSGAIGFTTTRSAAHRTSDGRPVASRQASWHEIALLVRSMPSAGRRVFELTPGTNPQADANAWDDEYDRIFALACDARVLTTFGLFGSRDQRNATLRRVEQSAARGAQVRVQTHSRGPSNVLSLKARLPFDVLPEWQDLRRLPSRRSSKRFETRCSGGSSSTPRRAGTTANEAERSHAGRITNAWPS